MSRVSAVWLLALWPVAASAGTDRDALAILSGAKAAMGGKAWDSIRTLHIRATFQAGDLQGTSESWLNIRHAFSYSRETVVSPTLGTIYSTEGWNGKVSWSADQTGDVCLSESEEARRNALSAAYADSFAYLFPNRFRVQFATGEGIQVAPAGGVPFQLWIDPATHLPQRIVQLKGIEKTTTTFSDFRPVSGLLLPFRSRVTRHGTDFANSSTITSIETNVSLPSHIFDLPQPHLSNLEYPPGRDSITLNFRYVDGEILLPVAIDGRPQERFVFDTGATNSIDARAAKELGLRIQASGLDYGGGPNASPAGLTHVERLEIGGLVMRDQVIGTSLLPDVRGTVGYELARRAVVIIDYANSKITFSKPGAFRPPKGAIAMPFQFAQSQVLVKASLNGVLGDFQIDTGMDGALEINRPFAERNGLLVKYGSGSQSSVEGVGGTSTTARFKPDRFEVGSLQPWLPHADIALSETGTSAQEFVAGTIGNRILQQFVLTLDYGRRVVYLEKNASFGTPDELEVETFDMGRRSDSQDPKRDGWLGFVKMTRRKGQPVEIVELDAHGPAPQAGVVVGDLITAINGTPVERLSGVEAARALIAPPGSEVRLTVKGKAGTREITLKAM